MTDPVHWLASLLEPTCYHIIIDTYRLRLQAEWGSVEEFCSGDYENSLSHFYEFLEGAWMINALPEWWKENHTTTYAKIAIDNNGDAYILETMDDLKRVVAKKYENHETPEQLMRVAERVYGWRDAY